MEESREELLNGLALSLYSIGLYLNDPQAIDPDSPGLGHAETLGPIERATMAIRRVQAVADWIAAATDEAQALPADVLSPKARAVLPMLSTVLGDVAGWARDAVQQNRLDAAVELCVREMGLASKRFGRQLDELIAEVEIALEGEPAKPTETENTRLADETAWVRASNLWPSQFDSYREAKRFLDLHPAMTRLKGNRREIHAGRWAAHFAKRNAISFDGLDEPKPIADDPNASGEFLSEAADRLAAVREKKQAAK